MLFTPPPQGFRPPQHNALYATPNVFFASPESVTDQLLYAESETSSHVTNDPNQMST
ncbi:hypothetical protein Scep_019183 [Stephania cephalantha]|uniref:Uncharacterized protein n=1 Tax=Stephania cephalantha TaxID=152367 RepID=A0AAP0IA92_9MAGN